jgi:hypothetical protein
VTVDKRAVANFSNKAMPFYRTPVSIGMSSLMRLTDNHAHALDVEVVTLDEALTEYGVEHVDYLKVDAEGYDLLVLAGFPFERMRPQVVMCEFSNSVTKRLGYTHDDLASYMIAEGYKIILSEWVEAKKVNGRYQHKWLGYRRYPCEGHALFWGNLIAVRDAYLFDKLLAQCGLCSG